MLIWRGLTKKSARIQRSSPISSIRFAVDALTNPNITGVSAVGLAAISAAFGLARKFVNNFNMLLLNVDHTNGARAW